MNLLPQGKKSELNEASPKTDSEDQVCIEFNGYCFLGNKRHVLLEQLEEQGIEIPYSCRSGICGACQIKKTSGEVRALAQGVIDKNGNIFSCSCIPKGDLMLSN